MFCQHGHEMKQIKSRIILQFDSKLVKAQNIQWRHGAAECAVSNSGDCQYRELFQHQIDQSGGTQQMNLFAYLKNVIHQLPDRFSGRYGRKSFRYAAFFRTISMKEKRAVTIGHSEQG